MTEQVRSPIDRRSLLLFSVILFCAVILGSAVILFRTRGHRDKDKGDYERLISRGRVGTDSDLPKDKIDTVSPSKSIPASSEKPIDKSSPMIVDPMGPPSLPELRHSQGIGSTRPPINGTPSRETPRIVGKVMGTVKLHGQAPTPGFVDLRSWPLCANKYPDGLRTEDLVVDPEGRVRWALVYISNGLESDKSEVPKESVQLSVSDCRYKPHVTALRAFQDLRIVNDDDQQHRVVQLRSDGTRNYDWPLDPGQSTKIRYSEGPFYMVAFRCDYHPWEAAWVGVSNHPYWAVTGEPGNYEISNLPVGRYTLAVWHERYMSKSLQIEVLEQTDTTADFELVRERR